MLLFMILALVVIGYSILLVSKTKSAIPSMKTLAEIIFLVAAVLVVVWLLQVSGVLRRL